MIRGAMLELALVLASIGIPAVFGFVTHPRTRDSRRMPPARRRDGAR